MLLSIVLRVIVGNTSRCNLLMYYYLGNICLKIERTPHSVLLSAIPKVAERSTIASILNTEVGHPIKYIRNTTNRDHCPDGAGYDWNFPHISDHRAVYC